MKSKKQLIISHAEISDYAAEGKALAKIDGKVIFVKGAVPGDVVDIQLVKSKKDWGEGQVLRFHKLSDRRVEPFCRHFGVCGGCSWQMIPYEAQVAMKQKQVADHLATCEYCRGEVRVYQGLLDEMPFAILESEPPPGL